MRGLKGAELVGRPRAVALLALHGIIVVLVLRVRLVLRKTPPRSQNSKFGFAMSFILADALIATVKSQQRT